MENNVPFIRSITLNGGLHSDAITMKERNNMTFQSEEVHYEKVVELIKVRIAHWATAKGECYDLS